MSTPIEKIDVNFAARMVEDQVRWIDIREFGVEGRGFQDTANFYDRWPARAKGKVPGPVWELGEHSAGMAVRFVTDATMISARWTLRRESLAMDHMPATGVSGLDLYTKTRNGWRWLGVGRPTVLPTNQTALISGPLDPASEPREMMLYLPLYNGVSSVEIGVPEAAAVANAPAYTSPKNRPLCFYGTSILHGGCASRPGACYPATVSRQLDWPHLNLGFSGSARCEPAVSELLAELDPAVYILDPLPNMTYELVEERMEPFVRTLHAVHPSTPILLIESIGYCDGYAVASRRDRAVASNRSLRGIHQKLAAGGMNVHLLPGERLLGDDGEGTVDGVHPTDLGFWRMAGAIAEAVGRVVG